MSEYGEALVAARFAARESEPLHGDWLDVQRRARRAGRRRRTLLVAAAVVFAALLIGSALGGRRVLDFFSADPAPHQVVAQFEDARRWQHAHGWVTYPAVGDQLRTVFRLRFAGGARGSIALAPTRDGFCMVIADSETGCNGAERERKPIELKAALPWLGKDVSGENLGLHDFVGTLTDPRTAHVVLRYEDGKKDDVPFIWVSKPIDAGFFAFDPTPEHYGKGHRASAFVVLDAKGHQIGRASLAGGDESEPRDEWAFPPRRGMPSAIDPATVHRLATRDLPAWLDTQVGRSKAGGQCFRVAHDLLGVCRKPGSVLNCCAYADSYGQKIHGRSRLVRLLYGFMASDAQFELSFEDGQRVVLRPHEGVVLYAFPPMAFTPGHRVTASAITKVGSGRVVRRWVDTASFPPPYRPGHALLEEVTRKGER